jgi:hypothetical protein
MIAFRVAIEARNMSVSPIAITSRNLFHGTQTVSIKRFDESLTIAAWISGNS